MLSERFWWLRKKYAGARCTATTNRNGRPDRCYNLAATQGLCKLHLRKAGYTVIAVSGVVVGWRKP